MGRVYPCEPAVGDHQPYPWMQDATGRPSTRTYCKYAATTVQLRWIPRPCRRVTGAALARAARAPPRRLKYHFPFQSKNSFLSLFSPFLFLTSDLSSYFLSFPPFQNLSLRVVGSFCLPLLFLSPALTPSCSRHSPRLFPFLSFSFSFFLFLFSFFSLFPIFLFSIFHFPFAPPSFSFRGPIWIFLRPLCPA